MAIITLNLEKKPFGFIATDEFGVEIKMDNIGTQNPNFGASPMQMLLMALAGCASIDMVMILDKQRQNYTSYQVKVEGVKEKQNDFSLWTKINIEFIIGGDVDEDKVNRAAQLSIDKYCSVAETLRMAGATIEYTVSIK